MRLKEKHNKEKDREKVERLTETMNKFSLLKNDIPITTSDEEHHPGKQI